MKHVESLPSPRFIKTHHPISMLPPDLLKKAKVIYVGRNVKDICVSAFYHARPRPSPRAQAPDLPPRRGRLSRRRPRQERQGKRIVIFLRSTRRRTSKEAKGLNDMAKNQTFQ